MIKKTPLPFGDAAFFCFNGPAGILLFRRGRYFLFRRLRRHAIFRHHWPTASREFIVRSFQES
jgi:hypothetical protein